MLWAYLLFVLLCLIITACSSPVIIRYTKGERACLSVHFIFFSASFFKKERKTEAEEKKKASGEKRAVLRALRYATPRTTVCLQALPFPTALPPQLLGLGLGAYYAVISVLLSNFKCYTSDPLLVTKKNDAPATDVRFRIRLYAFLHTFLIYLTQYKKEKEARKGYVGNKNE